MLDVAALIQAGRPVWGLALIAASLVLGCALRRPPALV